MLFSDIPGLSQNGLKSCMQAYSYKFTHLILMVGKAGIMSEEEGADCLSIHAFSPEPF